MDTVDCVVVGAGIMGLAVARALGLRGHEVVVLEAENAVGTHNSSRNSEVIHAGLHYPQASLKARLCVDGKRRLYAYCAERGIAHKRCGKLIVATSETERAELQKIATQAALNGVSDLLPLSAADVNGYEPALRCEEGLLSPSTGIVDSHAYMLALQGDAEAHGARIVLRTPVACATRTADGFRIETADADRYRFLARAFVNAAGLGAAALAAHIDAVPAHTIPRAYFAKGNYFALAGRAPFSRLVYPVPEPGGLGVHATLDLGGQVRFGPDVEWLDASQRERIDYAVDPCRAERFYAAIRRYWPGLKDGALRPGYAGIRPKLSPPGAPAADFRISGPAEHGIAGLVNLYGIESPGLTASLPLADMVADLV